MRKTNKLLSILLSLVMLIGILPLTVSASNSTGDVTWSLDENGVFTVSGEGAMEGYTSADEVPWKDSMASIKSVVIGEGITHVSDYGFYGATNLTSVTFENDYLYRIGEMTFYNCGNLKTVTIPGGVKEIGYGAFGCNEENKGLDTAYIYTRKTWFESCDDYDSPLVDTNALTFPEHTVIYGHASSDAYWYANINNRTFNVLEDRQVIKIENGENATYEFDVLNDAKVIDLWKSKDAETGSEHGVMLDYTFTVDVSDVVREYNYLPDGGDFYQLGYDKGNGGEIEFETEIRFDSEYQSSHLWGNAYYSLCETDYKGNARDYYKKWKTDVSDSFITMASDGEKLTVKINGSMKDIYEAACQYNEELDEYNLTDFAIIVKVDGITYYRGWGNSVYNEAHQVDYHSLWFYDAHGRDVFAPDAPAWSYEYLIEVEDYSLYDKPGYYEPVKKEYFWTFEFSKRKYEEIYNEETGDYEYYYYGFFDDGVEMEPGKNLYTEKAPDGKDYGVCFGELDAGEDNTLRIKQLLTDENKAFIDSMIGLRPDGDGGPVHLGLICDVTLTFPDGEVVNYSVSLDNEMNKLVAPCVHSCKICGACTVTDRSLPCNYHYSFGEAMFHCVCENPEPVEITVENVLTTNTTTAYMEAPVTVVIDKVDMTTASDTDFMEHITQDIREYEVYEVYNVDVYDEYSGNPYMLNQWGGSDEELTVPVPISTEDAEAIQNGEADIYHIDGDGTAEKVEDMLVEFDGENAVVNITSKTFSPFVIVNSTPKTAEATSVEVTKDTDANTCTVKYAITSTDLAKTPSLYIAFYTEQNKLITVSIVDEDIISSDEFTVSIPSGSKKCKVMLWEPTLAPLCVADDCDI